MLTRNIPPVAGVVRYAGISLILLGGFLMITDLKTSWKKKLWHMFAFGMISISLIVLNVYRNHLVTGTLTGYTSSYIGLSGASQTAKLSAK